jgi:hypothetical protein
MEARGILGAQAPVKMSIAFDWPNWRFPRQGVQMRLGRPTISGR